MMKLKITNPSQFEKLVEELEKSPAFAKGFRRGTVPNNYRERWEKISIALNALGPPKRSWDGWQKVWRDFKFKVKKKLIARMADMKDTGGLKFKHFPLTPLEESVANLLHLETEIQIEDFDQEIQSQDQNIDYEIVKIENISDIDDWDWTDVRNSSENESRELKSTNNPWPNVQCTTLRKKISPIKMNANNKRFKRKRIQKIKKKSNQYELIKNSMLSVNRSLQDLSECGRELLEIEKQKLKLMVEKNEREKEVHQTIVKIKNIELTMKEKELQLYNNFLFNF